MKRLTKEQIDTFIRKLAVMLRVNTKDVTMTLDAGVAAELDKICKLKRWTYNDFIMSALK